MFCQILTIKTMTDKVRVSPNFTHLINVVLSLNNFWAKLKYSNGRALCNLAPARC